MHKFQNIQAMRGVAVLLVVFFHMLSVENKYGGGGNVLPTWFEFGQFGVDLFFVISGFVMMTVTQNKSGSYHAVRFMYHRLTRIFPLYWFYSMLLLVVYYVKPSWVIGSHDRSINVTESFLLLPQNDYPLLSVGWTLIHELYFYLVFFVILWLFPERVRVYLLSAWATVLLLANLGLDSSSAVFQLVSSPLTVEFIAGCYIAIYTRSTKGAMCEGQLKVAAIATLLVSIVAYSYYKAETGLIGPAGWWRICIFGLPACLLVAIIVRAEELGILMWAKLRNVGDISYSIYLSHTLALIALGKIWSVISIAGIIDNLIVLPLLLVATLLIAQASYRYVEQPTLNFCRRWF